MVKSFSALIFGLSLSLSFALPNAAFAQTAVPEHHGASGSDREYTPMLKKGYEKLLTGKTIKGEYRLMRDLTNTYDFSETHNADGTTDYKEGAVRSKGIWYVLGEQKICYKYPNDKNMGGGTSCFWVYESENCYYGYTLNQMTLNGPRNYENWVARWILSGSGGTCALPTG